VYINSTILSATGCVAGPDWGAYLFSCTLGSPPSKILVVGSTAASTAVGASVQVATITLQVVSPVATLTSINGVSGGAHHQHQRRRRRPVQHLCGRSQLSASTAAPPSTAAWSLPWPAYAPGEVSVSPHARRLGACTVYGDTNADCAFNSADVLFVQRFLVGAAGYTNLSALTAWQRAAAEPHADVPGRRL
jgi:hypothetical protein